MKSVFLNFIWFFPPPCSEQLIWEEVGLVLPDLQIQDSVVWQQGLCQPPVAEQGFEPTSHLQLVHVWSQGG